jgi:hypothetical protein
MLIANPERSAARVSAMTSALSRAEFIFRALPYLRGLHDEQLFVAGSLVGNALADLGLLRVSS